MTNTNRRPAVTHEPGTIRLTDPEVLGRSSSSACLRFVARLTAVDEVQTIEIDHPLGEATIHYTQEVPVPAVLRKLAAALRSAEPDEVDENLGSLLSFAGEQEWTRVVRWGDAFSVWQMTRQATGQLCLRHEIVSRSGHVTQQLCRELAHLPQVERVTTDLPASRLIVDLGEAELDEMSLLRRADQIVREATGQSLPESARRELVATLSRVERGLNLALAGASFGMAVVGAAVPGIPTVPFLLVTSFFLVRSSPTLNDRLLRSRMFGPMLRDWQRHRGMRWQVKAWSIGFMALTFTITISFVEVSLPLLAVMLLLSGLGAYFILRLPTVPAGTDQSPERVWSEPDVPALTANYA